MALPNSGQLTLLDIVGEFGGTAPHGLQEYYGAAGGIPSSGLISIQDFYGASAFSVTELSTSLRASVNTHTFNFTEPSSGCCIVFAQPAFGGWVVDSSSISLAGYTPARQYPGLGAPTFWYNNACSGRSGSITIGMYGSYNSECYFACVAVTGASVLADAGFNVDLTNSMISTNPGTGTIAFSSGNYFIAHSSRNGNDQNSAATYDSRGGVLTSLFQQDIRSNEWASYAYIEGGTTPYSIAASDNAVPWGSDITQLFTSMAPFSSIGALGVNLFELG